MIPADEYKKLREELSEVVKTTRSLNLDLMSALPEDTMLKDFAGSIVGHLRTATILVMSKTSEGLSVAIWELHVTVKKAIKLFLEQRAIAYPKTHDLFKLRDLSRCSLETNGSDADFSKMISGNEAIKYRYCEGGNWSCDHMFEFYLATITIVSLYADNLDRSIGLKNARITFK